MKKSAALAGSALFFILAPLMVAGLIPWWLARLSEATFRPPTAVAVAGGILIAAGGLVLIESFVRFALKGLGTPAPVLPTRDLVVTGLYRYVRNPMYLGVLVVIAGQMLLQGSATILLYGVALWLAFHRFVIAYEEPTLRSTYGADYERFCAHVPRWIPRLRPWREAPKENAGDR